ncbi:MAG TPA: hypothetical protein VE987_22105, partial [Polyangiaceae bacterium]|nr:hypothetical protein [Polyangiaceae bacterium]
MRVAPVPVAPAAVARALVCAGAFALASLVAPPAAANGRYPASNQLLVSPTDPNLVVLRATYGIVLSRDGGSTWQWLCEDVLGVSSSSTVDPVLAVTGNGSLVAGPELSSGLFVSADTGCSWSAAPSPVADQLIKDLAVRPDAPDVVVAVGSTYAPDAGADGGPGYAQPIYQSADDGAHWSQLGAGIDPAAMVTTIEVASSDRARLYVSAVRGANATR